MEFSLVRYEVEMWEVDCGNDEWNHGIFAVVLCVAEDGDIRFHEGQLCRSISAIELDDGSAGHLLLESSIRAATTATGNIVCDNPCSGEGRKKIMRLTRLASNITVQAREHHIDLILELLGRAVLDHKLP
jgi:hypothetical protein